VEHCCQHPQSDSVLKRPPFFALRLFLPSLPTQLVSYTRPPPLRHFLAVRIDFHVCIRPVLNDHRSRSSFSPVIILYTARFSYSDQSATLFLHYTHRLLRLYQTHPEIAASSTWVCFHHPSQPSSSLPPKAICDIAIFLRASDHTPR